MYLPEIAATLLGTAKLSDGASLRIGQVFQSTVQSDNGNPTLQLGALKVALGTEAQNLLGKQVQVEVLQTKPQLILRFQAPANATTTQAPTGDPLTPLLATLLPQFKGLNDAALGTRLLPTSMPPNSDAIRQWLTLFFGSNGMGKELETLQQMANQGTTQGALTPELGQQLTSLLSQWLAPLEAGNLKQFLASIKQRGSVEAQLAQILKGGDLKALLQTLSNTLRQEIAQLRGNEAWLAYIRASGQLKQFTRVAEQILEHLEGSALQQIHRLEIPYVYLEVPLGYASGFHWAHVHWFGANNTRQQIEKNNSTIVLDLNLSNVGEIWIMLRTVADQYLCRFRVREQTLVTAIEEIQEELGQALSKAGFPGTHIQTTLWDGDRAAAMGEMFQRSADLNVKA